MRRASNTIAFDGAAEVTQREPDKREALRKQAFDLSPRDQFWLASVIAENVGYVLAKEEPPK